MNMQTPKTIQYAKPAESTEESELDYLSAD
jgi:hypothetical protein